LDDRLGLGRKPVAEDRRQRRVHNQHRPAARTRDLDG
jgi:hypothetical protein